MRALARAAGSAGASAAALLAARLRPQFAVPVILVDSADPVMGGATCIVSSCHRVAVLSGMCTAHRRQWTAAGRPDDVQAWATTAPASRRWLAEPARCTVSSCQRAQREFRLCHSHGVRWRKHGRPDRARWIADDGRGRPLPRTAECRFAGCSLDSEGAAGLCYVHRCRWVRNGRPPVDVWVADCAMFGLDRFDLRALPAPMRSEIAYAIQCRVDARRTKIRPNQIRRLLGKLPGSGARSLLDLSAQEWNSYLGFSSERGSVERRFLLDAIGYFARSGRRNWMGQ